MKYKKLVLWVTAFIMIASVIGLANVTAFDFDNIKNTKELGKAGYPDIEIKNLFGLGATLWEGELTKNTDTCGSSCSAEKTITIYDTGSLIDDVRFETITETDRYEQNIRSYQFYIRTGEETVDDYEWTCVSKGKYLNGSDILDCGNKKVGEHIEPIWEEYNLGKEVEAGTYEVKLEGEKKPSRTVDWQIKSEGIWIDDWAVWNPINSSTDITDYNGASTNSQTEIRGVQISAKYDLVAQVVTKGGSTATTAYIYNSSGTQLESSTFVGNNASFNTRLTADKVYYVMVNSGGASYTSAYNLAGFVDGININFSAGGYYGTAFNFDPNIFNIQAVTTRLDEGYLILNSPADDYVSPIHSIDFNCSATAEGGVTIVNMSLWTNASGTWEITQTLEKTGTTNESIFTETISEATPTLWTCQACDSDGDCGFASENRTVSVDTIAPSILALNSTFNYHQRGTNLTLSLNITDTNLDSCWYNYNETTNVTFPCANNYTSFNVTRYSDRDIYLYANDTVGNLNTTYHSWNYYVFQNSINYTTPTTELSSSIFSVNVTYDSTTYPSASGYLFYNGTSYLATKVGTGDTVVFTKTLGIPAVTTDTNISFYWNFVLGATTYSSLTYNQTVLNINIDDCTSYSELLYNFTIRDEETRVTYPYINGTLDVDLYISTYGTEDRAVTYSHSFNSTAQKTICMESNFTSYRVDMIADYEATDYVKEFYYIDNGIITNAGRPYNIDLHDLLSADSTTFLFKFTDEDGLKVQNAIVLVYRNYIGDGIYREVERAKTDDNGETHVHLVEEDVIYYFVIIVDGETIYTSDNYNAKCLSTPCSIELSSISSTHDWTVLDNEGSKYDVSSNKATRTVTMSFLLNQSDLVNMSLYQYSNTEPIFINMSSVTSQSGTLSFVIPMIYDNSTFFVAIYRNNEFVKSVFVDMTSSAIDYFGVTGAILGGIIVLTIILMAVSEGAGFIVFLSLSLIIIWIMKLVDLNWMAVSSIIIAGGVIVFKLIKRRQNA